MHSHIPFVNFRPARLLDTSTLITILSLMPPAVAPGGSGGEGRGGGGGGGGGGARGGVVCHDPVFLSYNYFLAQCHVGDAFLGNRECHAPWFSMNL